MKPVSPAAFALIATKGLGCNDTAIKTIQVTPSPIIDAGRNVRIFDDEIAQIDIQGENLTGGGASQAAKTGTHHEE